MDKLQGSERAPLSIFISYAHEDEPLRQQLDAHLSLLRRQGLIATWHDRQIMPGTDWSQELDAHLMTAQVILLLISADFLASDYCYAIEMQRALEHHQRGEVRVIPVILRPCDWQISPFAHLQCLPRGGKAVTIWQNPDEALLTIAQGLRRVIEQQHIPARPFPEVERQNRLRLLKQVRQTWIEGVLEHSLHQAALITLDLQEQPDALANPWQLVVQETTLPPHPLPAGTSIVQVYDEADGALLILGEPGAGKTTLLLQLAQTLLDRAHTDERLPLSVIFNLSSWAQKQEPLARWLVEELKTKYRVNDQIGQHWIAMNQILPLLDGLDEVAELARIACVRAITAYYLNHPNQVNP
ncbi:MAG TPA: TIR domain-containing protein, partial [Ktedonobacteraceae bacterium]|nr:TIR domain-containing protein [Ktedonobacteraceae bacterium]